MGLQFSIDSEEAYRMASRLAELTGESLVEAAAETIRERLDRRSRTGDQAALQERLQALAAGIHAHMQQPAASDHGWLCDTESGLPR
jgi:antitoxin VapB